MPPTIKSNLVWTAYTQGTMAIIGLLSSIVISRWLGPEARGIYVLALTTGGILSSLLGSDSLHASFTYVTGKGIAQPCDAAAQAFWLVLIAGSLVSVCLYIAPSSLLQQLLPGISRNLLWMIILLTVSLTYGNYLNGILIGQNEIQLVSKLALFDSLISIVINVVFLVALNLGLSGAMWQIIIMTILRLLMTVLVIRWKYRILSLPNLKLFKSLFTYAIKLYPSYLGVMLVSRMDVYFLAVLSGPSSVGIYSLAKGLAQMIDILEQPISRAIAPMVVSESLERASQIIVQAFRSTLLLCLVVAVVGAASSPLLIPLVYGHEYSVASDVFIILIIGLVFATTRMFNSFFSLQMGKPEYSTLITLGVSLFSVPFFYGFIQLWGIIGAAIAYTLIFFIRGFISTSLFLILTRHNIRSLIIKASDIKMIWSYVRR